MKYLAPALAAVLGIVFAADAYLASARPSVTPGGARYRVECTSNVETSTNADHYLALGGADVFATNTVAANAPFAEEVVSWCAYLGETIASGTAWSISWHVEGADVGTSIDLVATELGECANYPGVTWEKFEDVLIEFDITLGSGATGGAGVCALLRQLPSALGYSP